MIIGLTGKSCSGKNFVSQMLSRRGFTVMDLDRECALIRRRCQTEILQVFNTQDPKEIAKIVFSDPQKRKQLEDILYPRLKEQILNCKYDLVINGATLHRSGFDGLCSYIIYVDAPYEVRCKRALKRDKITQEAFFNREQAQADIDYRTADYRCPVYVLDNSDSVKEEDLDRILTGRKDS